MSVRMKALKRFSYAGRRIAKGEKFYARSKDVYLLGVMKRAKPVAATDPAKKKSAEPAPAAVEAPADAPAEAELTALRAEYYAAFEKRAYNGWDAATLRAKIDAKNAGAAE